MANNAEILSKINNIKEELKQQIESNLTELYKQIEMLNQTKLTDFVGDNSHEQ